MSCWCGSGTQQQDYPPFGYVCTDVPEHDPFDPRERAWLRCPERMGNLTYLDDRIKAGFMAGWDAAEEAQRQWEVQQVEARVIPSRSTDPVTSHKAAAAVTVKANTQRAHLLNAFYVDDRMGVFSQKGLTDEEAMHSAQHVVAPNSEYSKRCSELREAGLIEPTGETRTGASGHQRIVSRITEAGRKVVQSL